MNSLRTSALLTAFFAAGHVMAAQTPVFDLGPGHGGKQLQQESACPTLLAPQDEDGAPTTELTRKLRERYGDRADHACGLNNQESQRKLWITDGPRMDQVLQALGQLVTDSSAFLDQDQQSLQTASPQAQLMVAAGGQHGPGSHLKLADMPVIGLLVPEPSTYAMLLSGLGLVAWRLRSKRRIS